MPESVVPKAAHADLDSMLSRKFGKEVANYFSGKPALIPTPNELTLSRFSIEQGIIFTHK